MPRELSFLLNHFLISIPPHWSVIILLNKIVKFGDIKKDSVQWNECVIMVRQELKVLEVKV